MSREILQSIIDNFDLQRFRRFFSEKNRNFVPSEENLNDYDKDDFAGGSKLGEISLDDGNLIVCAFEVKKELSERSGKKAQYDLGKKLLRSSSFQRYNAGIFIFCDKNMHFRFSLIYDIPKGNRRDWNNFRRFTYFVSNDEKITNKTFLKQIGERDFSTLEHIREAFSLSAVTDIFYKDFFVEYNKVVESVKTVNKITDQENARDFVLLFAIRTIFLGFIQKKGWIGNDEKFIQNLFTKYEKEVKLRDNFYGEWLSLLFFESFNHKFSPRQNLPKDVNYDFQMAPYLNGGLFKEKPGYDNQGWYIPDLEIKNFFDFLFSYSFTIEENSLADEDLQLNPEFLGIIFERLVNKADGAVYTPRTEVDLMCRLSLVKWLKKNLTLPIRVENLYELFFREGKSELDQKDGSFSEREIHEILRLLEGLTICDPAVGSGAFLVGMAQVLDDVEQKLKERIGQKNDNVFERKKIIIANSLYGVEVKEWAVWICQLRLWLSLFIDASDELKNSVEPILPSLDFKVRQGDSLVQRVGSKLFPVTGHIQIQSNAIKSKITQLKNLKIEYFDNKTSVQDWELRHRELAIYNEILDSEIKEKENKWRNLKNIKPSKTMSLFGDEDTPEQTILELNNDKIENLEREIAELKEQKIALQKEKPLVWGIEFAEIFAEKGGFDIIIGNPPYVRQEDIADPMGKIKDKKEYKNLLAEMVKLDFPEDFPPKIKINAQSDLYTYFYIRGLRLLNPQGIHTFICSNSWLDVGYGVWLQKFLLERAPLEMIIDNHAKRSFEAADVNTIISIIHAPVKKVDLDRWVKFVVFKKPFDEAVFTENLLAIENAKQVESNDILRVYPISIKDLRASGVEYEDDELKLKSGKYVGDKWGGKYLRAPEIYWKISESYKHIETQLKAVAEINRGITTGADDWFYLDNQQIQELGIDNKYTRPIITYPGDRNIKAIKVGIKNADKNVIITDDAIKNISSKGLINWIEIGETKEFKGRGKNVSIPANRPTLTSRKMWYSLSTKDPAPILWIEVKKRRHLVLYNPAKLLVDRSFYEIHPKKQTDTLALYAILNCTITILESEIIGNGPGGSGAGLQIPVVNLERLRIINPNLLTSEIQKELANLILTIAERNMGPIYTDIGIDPTSEIPIEEQEPNPLPDRARLDTIAFDILGLTNEERKDVYRAVCRLVWNRLSKAKSV